MINGPWPIRMVEMKYMNYLLMFAHGIVSNEIIDAVINVIMWNIIISSSRVGKALTNDPKHGCGRICSLLIQYRTMMIDNDYLEGADVLRKCDAFDSLEPEELEFVIVGLCRLYIRSDNMYQLQEMVRLLTDKKQCDELIDYVRKKTSIIMKRW